MHLYSKKLPQRLLQWLFLYFIAKFKPQHGMAPDPGDLLGGVIPTTPKAGFSFHPCSGYTPSVLQPYSPPTHTHPNPDESQPHAALLLAPLSPITASTIHCAVTHTSVSLVDIEQDSQDGLISLRWSPHNCGEHCVPWRQKVSWMRTCTLE